jgi:hypothetical protein
MKGETNNELPEGFVPADIDVICGWARQNYHHGRFVVVVVVVVLISGVPKVCNTFDKLSHNPSVSLYRCRGKPSAP